MLTLVLKQAADIFSNTEYLRTISAENSSNYIVDYLMRIKDHLNPNELRFY
jgi:hypothetical protein